MICNRCQGKGMIKGHTVGCGPRVCPDCYGSRQSSCCDGSQQAIKKDDKDE